MCSSPRSSGNVRPVNVGVKGIFAQVSQSSRQNFAAIANSAEERRERIREQKRQLQKQSNTSIVCISKKTKQKTTVSLFSWLFEKDLLSIVWPSVSK